MKLRLVSVLSLGHILLLCVLVTGFTTGCQEKQSSKSGVSEATSETLAPTATKRSQHASAQESTKVPATDGQIPSSEVETVKFAGSETCVQCHAARHESYQDSHHSRSLTEVDLHAETLAGKIVHEASRRKYEVVSRGDELWHVEKLLEKDVDAPDELTLSEFPIRYVMGSGKFAKGYIVSDQDYLLQSPLTWYAAANEYAMSPGYDTPMHGSFSRSLTDQCFFCHAGRVERKQNNPHHFAIHELSIGCERCHGAGGSHVDHYQSLAAANLPAIALANDPIINPSKLSREAAQSLCAQCHRQGVAPVSTAGKNDWDFQPGQDFATVKFTYDLVKTDPPENGFVGHFAQLGESKCYQRSQMTCITCHSPHRIGDHQSDDNEALHERHRKQCNACHADADQSCGLPMQVRIDNAHNRCVSCHMPKRDSKVPHTSTTDHRIAIHQDSDLTPTLLEDPVVYPLQEVPESMPQQQADRMRALGLFGLYRMNVGNPHMDGLRNKANNALSEIANRGQGDSDVFAAMAYLTFMNLEFAQPDTPQAKAQLRQQWEYAMSCAQESLRLHGMLPGEPDMTEGIGDAMEVAGRYFSNSGQDQLAAKVFSELAAIRRRKYDWATLGLSLGKIGDNEKAEQAMRQAIHVFGGDPDLYEILAIVLKSTDPNEAERLNGIARRLRAAAEN